MADVAGIIFPPQIGGVTFAHPPSSFEDSTLYQGVKQRVLSGRLLEDLPYCGDRFPDRVTKAQITLAWEDSIVAEDARLIGEITALAGSLDICVWKRRAAVWSGSAVDTTFRLPWRLALEDADPIPPSAPDELPTEVRVDGVLLTTGYTIGSPDEDGRPLLTIEATPAAGVGNVRLWGVPLYAMSIQGAPTKIPSGGIELFSLTFEEI